MLSITLQVLKPELVEGEPLELRATYRNEGAEPLGVPLWWTQRLRIADASGAELAPGPGPVLPCGIPERVQVLDPGASLVTDVPFACTQPAGQPLGIGWSYQLEPGRYRVTLIYEFPPRHGFGVERRESCWRGRAESNPVELMVTAKPGLMARLFGR